MADAVVEKQDAVGAEPMEMQCSGNTDSNASNTATGLEVPAARGPLLPDNPEDSRCYCGEERDLNVPEFQCGMCLRFYHAKCLDCEIGLCVPFMTNYQFFCKRCSVQESLVKRPASFSQMCLTAVANLQQQGGDKKYHSKDKEIIPFIEKNWELLTTAPRRVKQTWHTTIAKTMQKDLAIFQFREESPGESFYGLIPNLDLTKIGPNCESTFRLTNASYTRAEQQKSTTSESFAGKGGRGTKRKGGPTGESTALVNKRRGDVGPRLTPKSYPPDHPYNKDGYRYILAEPDPHAPNWQAFDESIEWAGKPIPGYLYRKYLETKVQLALHDRATQLKISDDRLTVTGEKGYSMIRASHGVKRGAWYFEVHIDEMPDGTATRLGWSQALGNLQAPCGYDKFSYSWRSRKGTKFHQSRGRHYSDEGYKQGDVLGFFIYLPIPDNPSELLPTVYKDKPLVKFKSHLYYEEKDYVSEAERKLESTSASKMLMYKNGVCQGVAFEDVFDGVYYPAVSLYKNVTVSLKFGPDFKYAPTDQGPYKPMSDAAETEVVDHAIGDILFFIDNEGQLPEF